MGSIELPRIMDIAPVSAGPGAVVFALLVILIALAVLKLWEMEQRTKSNR